MWFMAAVSFKSDVRTLSQNNVCIQGGSKFITDVGKEYASVKLFSILIIDLSLPVD